MDGHPAAGSPESVAQPDAERPSGGEEEGMRGRNPRDSGVGGCAAERLGKKRAHAPGNWIARRVPSLGAALLAGVPAHASETAAGAVGRLFGASEVIQVATFAGVMSAAILSAIWLIRERGRIAAENLDLRARIAELNASVQRSDALFNLKDSRHVVWSSDHRKPTVTGSLADVPGIPEERATFLAFGRWLQPHSAAALENAVSALRERGASFDLVVETSAGGLVEVQGRRAAASAVVRFMGLTERRKDHARLKIEHARLVAHHETILALLDTLETPFWLRDQDGRIEHVNQAYAIAMECENPQKAVEQQFEFLNARARAAIAHSHSVDAIFDETVSTVIGGDRRLFAVTDVKGSQASAGLAIDRSEVEALRAELERVQKSHADTLDQLTTAVAIFDAGQKLLFYNQAFQELWELDPAFLASKPDNTLLLDRLRSAGKLAEQPEWRRWKENVLAAYRSAERVEHLWHLPDGRTLRVIANPHPQGGVAWVFDNMTERFDLESRYNAAMRVQGETLDNLAEGVAVFGSDGKIRLYNPAFTTLWRLPADEFRPETHIAAISQACERVAVKNPWPGFVASVTGFDDERRESHGQIELVDGTILSHALIPLPNGQVMLTFVDVTDSVNFERALQDKNEALQRADRLKNEFVQHVSYELRSPLTNIIGFTELLTMPETGELNARQREYVDHIGSSSSVLLTIVNDILDLATVDAGIMELDYGEVPIAATVDGAADLIAEKLREHSIRLSIDTRQAPAFMHADENRLRQVLFNLLSNAANYAPEHSTIELVCREEAGGVVFTVHDSGPGMPPEILDSAFKRFEPRANGGRHRGAGLGLAIVKSFVELHGGAVEIESGPHMRGTRVTCRFPLAPVGARAAAE